MSEVEFEPFQKVLVRDEEGDEWRADFFSHIYIYNNEKNYVCVGHVWEICIPYNDETAHLLGTTDSPTPPEPKFKWGDKVEVKRHLEDAWIEAIFVGHKNHNNIHEVWAIYKDSIATDSFTYCRHADW